MADPAENAVQETAADIEGQLLSFGDTDNEGPTEFGQPEIVEEVVEPERRSVGWEDVLPDDPNLPPTYRGQRTVADIWAERTDLVQRNNRANQLLNEKEAELRTMRATMELLANSQKAAPAAQEQRGPTFKEQSDIDFDRELLVDPNAAMSRFRDKLREEIKGEVLNEFQGTVQEIQSKQKEAEAKQFFDSMANATYYTAANLQVPKEVWNKQMKYMMTAIWEHSKDIRAFHDPRWWEWAHSDLLDSAALPRQAQPTPSFGNPGTNTKSAGIRSSSKPLPDRYRKLAAQYAQDFGVDPAQLENEIRKDYESGRVR